MRSTTELIARVDLESFVYIIIPPMEGGTLSWMKAWATADETDLRSKMRRADGRQKDGPMEGTCKYRRGRKRERQPMKRTCGR